MAAAYLYADGGPLPREILLAQRIAQYGVEAVMGRRTLGAGEIRRMNAAQNIVSLYEQRARGESWAAWAVANPEGAAALNMAMLMAEELEHGG